MMRTVLSRHPLKAFVALSFLGSWIGWSPWWLSQNGIGLLPLELPFAAVAGINQLGLFAGPFAASLVMTHLTDGRAGVRRFWSAMVKWRVHWVWYMMALIAIPVATGLGYLVTAGRVAHLTGADGALFGLLSSTYVVYLLGGPIQEEPGWRGYALPRLQQRMHPVTAAIVLGLIHCFWHAPLFLTAEWETARQDPSQYLAYLILVISMSFVMSWLANRTHGSMLLVILGHNGINWAIFAAGVFTDAASPSNWPAAIGLACLAIFAILTTKGRLGFPANRGQPPERLTESAIS